MKIVDIANEIFLDEGSPTSTSVPAIAFWVRGRIGELNNLTFESFSINDSYEVVDESGGEISIEAVSILKKLYKIYDYDIQIKSNMTSLTTDAIIEVNDQGSSVKKVNRNEVSKTLATLKNTEQEALNNLITSYKMKGASPRQVSGDDTIPASIGENITDLRNVTV